MRITAGAPARVKGRAEFLRLVPELSRAAAAVPPRRAAVVVSLVGSRRMASLNRRYKGRRGAAEILTFAYGAGPGGGEWAIGEIYLTWERLASAARARRVSRRAYGLRLLVHGLCHLRGHRHGDERSAERMEAVERRLLAPHVGRGTLERLFA